MNKIPFDLPAIIEGEDKSSPFVNCIRKNYRHMKKFAKRTMTDCFRIYDGEVAGYPLAIDFYAGKFCVHYFSPYKDNEELKNELVEKTEQALFVLFHAQEKEIYWRTRHKAKLTRQYEKTGESKEFFAAFEYGAKFYINLRDYVDTGLFLDHREARHFVSLQAKSKKLLNLFSYTGSFSVHAALQGALSTKSVDMSNTYTKWAKDNFILNGIPLKNHEFIRADCLKFLDEEIKSGAQYDIIVIDPPTISRSKKMDQLFDVQVDYVDLILKSLKLLVLQGFIFFSTNSRKFKFDDSLFPFCKIREVSAKTVPIDFHDKKIHRSWLVSLL
ncbi:MAG TPA: class I SAM-dependent methyltransferase [Parachlamydiaceae bacterium]|nr:class I SAM-dependent methyltransferase [Parachlamydiaceae bacterium]